MKRLILSAVVLLTLYFITALKAVNSSDLLTEQPLQGPAGDCLPAITVTSSADSGPGSLRQAIVDLCAAGSIDFNLPLPATIALSSGELLVDKPLIITGPGASALMVSGSGSSRVFNIGSYAVWLAAFTIQDGLAVDGGGIWNAGSLALYQMAVAHNVASHNGGGIYSTGTLNISRTVLQENEAVHYGGGLWDHGPLLLSQSTLAGNTAYDPGGLVAYGGGIYHAGGDLTIHNATFSANLSEIGAGVHNAGAADIRYTTFADNTAESGSAISNCDGCDATVAIQNNIFADSGSPYECSGLINLTSLGYNLSQDDNCNLTGPGDIANTPAQLLPLADNGGLTWTHALYADSPAIDAGSCQQGQVTTDQRGYPRPVDVPTVPNVDDGCDIGAYETEILPVAFLITKSVNNPTPVYGEIITYTVAIRNIGVYSATTSAVISDTLPPDLLFVGPATLEPPQPEAILAQDAGDLPMLAGQVTVMAGQTVTVTFAASVDAAAAAQTIVNTAAVHGDEAPLPRADSVTITTCFAAATVTSSADSGPGTLRQAITDVCPGGVIDFALELPVMIPLVSGDLALAKPLHLNGPGAELLTVSGSNQSRIFTVTAAGVYLDGLTLSQGNDAGDGTGGAIFNTGVLTISHATIVDNEVSTFLMGYAYGGGIYNRQGRIIIQNSTLADNSVLAEGGIFEIALGGGIYNREGVVILQNSTLSHNRVWETTDYPRGGGIYNSGGVVRIESSTLAENNAINGGGGIYNADGMVTLRNSLVANNGSGGDCDGDSFTSLGNNLDSDGSCNLTDPGDLPGVNPLLGPLADNGGPTLTHALLPGSPAIDAGVTTACPPVDQRGVARPQGAACDMGAYEAVQSLLALQYVYAMNDGSAGSGVYELWPNGLFTDDGGGTGTWQYVPGTPQRLMLRYDAGQNCTALSIGQFISPTNIRGSRFCRDGSGGVGVWFAEVVADLAR